VTTIAIELLGYSVALSRHLAVLEVSNPTATRRSFDGLSDPSYSRPRCSLVGCTSASVQHTATHEEIAAMQTNPTPARESTPNRDRLNVLMEAVALIIARRQMKHHWAPSDHRATLPSII
jgi:hypothetical protein